jgi:S-adenosylmethionine:tRNA ribosyltransferase-isomerase
VSLMEKHGTLPLPPYIKDYPSDPESYQTVYAARLGSAAAPTAGLHFTPAVLDVLTRRGIDAAYVTLHVGLDTFQPIREEVVEDHRIHRETYSVTAENMALLRATRAHGGRLVAVGTTATRVLETLAGIGAFDIGKPGSGAGAKASLEGDVGGDTEIFIIPGYRFRAVDLLLTNFHLPRSSVLALVMAFAGADRLRAAYEEAIALRYRFFSFGDAMFVEKHADPGPAIEGRP